MAQDKRRCDATWLAIGMLAGAADGIGTGMILLGSRLLRAIAGMLRGRVIGIVRGSTPRRGEGTAEEAEDEYVRRQQEAAGELPPRQQTADPEGSTEGEPQDRNGRDGADGRP